MRKYQFLGLLASLTAILLFTQSSPVLGDTIFRGNCEGFAPYTPGEDAGIFISCSSDRTSWSIRWSGDANRNNYLTGRVYNITGDIKAQQITDIVEVSFDGDEDSSNLRTVTNHDILSFNAVVDTGEDGLDFTTTGWRVLFNFDENLVSGSGSYTLTPANIFIGSDGRHPASVNFFIERKIETLASALTLSRASVFDSPLLQFFAADEFWEVVYEDDAACHHNCRQIYKDRLARCQTEKDVEACELKVALENVACHEKCGPAGGPLP